MTMQATQEMMDAKPQAAADGAGDGALRVATAKVTKVSIVIPVYNEEATVQELVGLVVRAPLPAGLRRAGIPASHCAQGPAGAELGPPPRNVPGRAGRGVSKPGEPGERGTLWDGGTVRT